jgi:hypothetical protein
MKKNRKPIPKSVKRERIARFLSREDELRSKALNVDLDVRVTSLAPVIHVMFDFFGERVLDWWPSTGTTYSFDGQTKIADDLDAALELAADTLKRHPSALVHEVVE